MSMTDYETDCMNCEKTFLTKDEDEYCPKCQRMFKTTLPSNMKKGLKYEEC